MKIWVDVVLREPFSPSSKIVTEQFAIGFEYLRKESTFLFVDDLGKRWLGSIETGKLRKEYVDHFVSKNYYHIGFRHHVVSFLIDSFDPGSEKAYSEAEWGGLEPLDFETYKNHHEEHFAELFCNRVAQYFVLLNLNFSGGFEILDYYYGFDQRIYGQIERNNPELIRDAVELQELYKWPNKFEYLPCEVWKLMMSMSSFVHQFSDNKVSRAFNCLSKVLCTIDNASESLIWAVIGIESLFCTSNTGVKDQIREKTQSIFGRNDIVRKRINQVYEHRSNFLHGVINVPFIPAWNPDENFERLDSDIYQSSAFATLILISSINYIFSTKNFDFDFQYVLNEKL